MKLYTFCGVTPCRLAATSVSWNGYSGMKTTGTCLAILVVWLVTVITFLLLKALPGGPVRAILGTHASDPALVQALTAQLGLDKPIWYQYWSWLDGFLHGNFGFSYVQNQLVASLLGQRLPRTLLLLGTATLLALLIAVPFGIIQAVRRNRAADYVGTGFSFLFYAMPVYLTGIILINVFVFETHTFPAEGAQGGTSAGNVCVSNTNTLIKMIPVRYTGMA